MSGFQATDHDQHMVVHAQPFDQMMASLMAPCLAKHETFQTKEVPLPTTVYKMEAQLAGTSIMFDVVLGPIHPLAHGLWGFCLNEWPLIEAPLQASMEDHTTVLLLIL